jgi:hypothetical protein
MRIRYLHTVAISLADELLNDFLPDDEGHSSKLEAEILVTVAEKDEENAAGCRIVPGLGPS